MRTSASFFYGLRLIFPGRGRSSSSNAAKSLRASVACIALSMVPLICVLVMTDGMISGITDRITGLSSYHCQLVFGRSRPQYSDEEALFQTAREISEYPGVRGAYPELRGIGLAAGKNGRFGATVRAVQDDMFSANGNFSSLFKVEQGEASLEPQEGGSAVPAVIGHKLAEQLGANSGDRIRLILIGRQDSGMIAPKSVLLLVRGVVSSGYQELDAMWVFIPIGRAFSLMSERNVIVGIDTEDALSPELGLLESRLRNEHPRGAAVYNWKELNVSQFQNLSSTKVMLVFVMFLIVLVASVNISSSLVMLVMERRREIAILKSLGASSGGIKSAFLLAGFCCGAVGVLLGMPVGLALGVNINSVVLFLERAVNAASRFAFMLLEGDSSSFSGIRLLDPAYYLQGVPIDVPFSELLAIAAGTVLLSLLASVVPSVRAGRERPLDTFRKV